jgi:DNA-binding beta-propeller fold protein YncE
MKPLWAIGALLLFAAAPAGATPAASPLKLVAKYPIPASVQGRLDHVTADLAGNRLFLAAETAHEVLVFNLRTGKLLHLISGIEIPHAIFVRDDLHRIFVTDGGPDGEVHIYDGRTYRQLNVVKLKAHSDSVGYDPATQDLYVDNGGGDAHETFTMLSIINTKTDAKIADIRIDGSALEAMALAKSSPLLYVDNPAKVEVDVVNRRTRKLVAKWVVPNCVHNAAIALDEPAHRLYTACRSGSIVVFDTQTGKALQSLPIAKNVDDLIFDPVRKRLYASCADGPVSVYQVESPNHYSSIGEIATPPGGKNEVLVPSLERFFVPIPASKTATGEILVYKVQ